MPNFNHANHFFIDQGTFITGDMTGVVRPDGRVVYETFTNASNFVIDGGVFIAGSSEDVEGEMEECHMDVVQYAGGRSHPDSDGNVDREDHTSGRTSAASRGANYHPYTDLNSQRHGHQSATQTGPIGYQSQPRAQGAISKDNIPSIFKNAIRNGQIHEGAFTCIDIQPPRNKKSNIFPGHGHTLRGTVTNLSRNGAYHNPSHRSFEGTPGRRSMPQQRYTGVNNLHRTGGSFYFSEPSQEVSDISPLKFNLDPTPITGQYSRNRGMSPTMEWSQPQSRMGLGIANQRIVSMASAATGIQRRPRLNNEYIEAQEATFL